MRISTDADSLFCLLLQIATFFSNNLDFFTSAAYSPKGSTVALSPLQAESMLANKKKASAYIHAIRKVSWLNQKIFCNFAFLCKSACSMFNHLLWNIMDLVDIKCVKIVAVNLPNVSPRLCLSGFSRGPSQFRTAKPCPIVVFSQAPPRAEKVSLSRYVTGSKHTLQNPFQQIRIDLCKGHVSFLQNRALGASGYRSALIEL